MLKKGFTLQELLISLAIIGVVASVTLPSLMNMQPDKRKTMYMKAYNTLTTQIADIMEDPSLYWDTYNANGDIANSGLASNAQPSIAPYNGDTHCQGATKFPAILSHRLNLNGNPTYADNTTTFRTTDGIEWVFNATNNAINVTINLYPEDNSGGNPCTYNATNCRKPNQFTFAIDNDGGITPTDTLGQTYLQDSTNLRSGNANNTTTQSGE